MGNNREMIPGPFTLLRILLHLPSFARVFWGLFRDGRVSFFAKLIPVAVIAWIVFTIPIDAIPTFGAFNLAVILIGGRIFVACCPRSVVAEHIAAAGGRPRGSGI